MLCVSSQAAWVRLEPSAQVDPVPAFRTEDRNPGGNAAVLFPRFEELLASAELLKEEQAIGEDEMSDEDKKEEERRPWNVIVAELVGGSNSSSQEEVKQLLIDAVASVQADEKWKSSGVFELLQRALDTANRGFPESARKSAIGLLDFHKVVERYRSAAVTKSNSSGDPTMAQLAFERKRSHEQSWSTSSEGEDDPTETLSDSPKRARADASPPASPAAISRQGSTPTAALQKCSLKDEFAVPSGSGIRRSVRFQKKQQQLQQQQLQQTATGSAAAAAAAAAHKHGSKGGARIDQSPKATWTGPLRHCQDEESLELCCISVQVPCTMLAEMPEELQISHLVQRNTVKLGKYMACRTSITAADKDQHVWLQGMAQYELVAMVPLENCGIIVVPYFDSAESVKVVSFLVL